MGGGGFEEQLNTVLHDHPDVGLVIVDVLQKIRNPMEQSSYNKTTDGFGCCCRRKGEFQWYQDT